MDNDNSAEIIVIGNIWYVSGESPGISVFGDANGSWVNTRKIWNQHAYHITNVNDDSTIPAVEPNSWESHNTYRCNASSEALACRDLSASHLIMDQAEYPSSVDLTARVGNSGWLHFAAGVNVSFYNGDPEDGGILLGTVRTTTRLYPGQYEDVALTWADPPDGQLTLYARVDDDGTGVGRERESNENNNQALTVRTLGNNAPIAAGGSDRDVYWGETVYLDGSASSDADGETLTYQWEMTARPDNSQAVLSDPTSATPSFVADSPGVYRVELVVNDGFDDSPADLVTIDSRAVIAPDLAGLDQAGAENALISAGLSLGTVVETENDAPAGQVLAQDPAAVNQTVVRRHF